MSHLDWVPTLMAAVDEAQIKQQLMQGHRAGDNTFKVHLDGSNVLPYLTGKTDTGPRDEFFYFSADGKLLALRSGDWKLVLAEQRARQFKVWREPLVDQRIPKLFNPRRDPYVDHSCDSQMATSPGMLSGRS